MLIKKQALKIIKLLNKNYSMSKKPTAIFLWQKVTDFKLNAN